MKETENGGYLPNTSDEQRMDFRQHVPLGRTGLMVGRLGIASGFGVPATSIEEAFHRRRLLPLCSLQPKCGLLYHRAI
jgi:hypothetical protein